MIHVKIEFSQPLTHPFYVTIVTVLLAISIVFQECSSMMVQVKSPCRPPDPLLGCRLKNFLSATNFLVELQFVMVSWLTTSSLCDMCCFNTWRTGLWFALALLGLVLCLHGVSTSLRVRPWRTPCCWGVIFRSWTFPWGFHPRFFFLSWTDFASCGLLICFNYNLFHVYILWQNVYMSVSIMRDFNPVYMYVNHIILKSITCIVIICYK